MIIGPPPKFHGTRDILPKCLFALKVLGLRRCLGTASAALSYLRLTAHVERGSAKHQADRVDTVHIGARRGSWGRVVDSVVMLIGHSTKVNAHRPAKLASKIGDLRPRRNACKKYLANGEVYVVTSNEATNVCYSIVVPAFNESESISALIEDLVWLMGELDGTCEVLIVDDGSDDETYEIARSAQEMDRRFRVIRLSRNFGHQMALTAGLMRARGEAVVTMDADRQHPVEAVLEMARYWRNGYDIAYGVMMDRPSESIFKKATSNGFYKLINRMSDTPMTANAGDFRLLDRQVVDAFLRMPEHNRYIRGMISWLGFEQVGVPYTCARRHGGRSTYTVRRMIKFAVDAILSFSTWTLRAGLAVGFIISGLSVLFGLTNYPHAVVLPDGAWVGHDRRRRVLPRRRPAHVDGRYG
jgi:dolichol-phosphate mannosyltransferase